MPPVLPSLICKRKGDPQRLAGLGCARLGPVDSDFHFNCCGAGEPGGERGLKEVHGCH